MSVAVIMPCKNCEAYLEESLKSVLSQSMPDLTVYLVDDGSQDNSIDIAQKLAKTDTRLQILENAGHGVSDARNTGLDRVKEDWIFFMDCDDVLPEHALSVLLSSADENTDLIVAAHETFGEDQPTVPFWPEQRWMDLPWPERQHAMILRLIEGDSVLNIMCNKLHRARNLTNLRLSSGLRVAEDALFNLEAVLDANRAVYVHRITYRYRMHAHSTMNSAIGSQFELHKSWLQALRGTLRAHHALETYYGAYLDSVVLRLYKDGGIPGVLHDFNRLARPLVDPAGLSFERMNKKDRKNAERVQNGTYLWFYPGIAAEQILMRKKEELSFERRKAEELSALEGTDG